MTWLQIGALLALTGVALSAGACTGEGSDIGPNIARLPVSSYQVLVRPDAEVGTDSLGVSGAVVSVRGLTETAVSGRSGRADVRSRPTGIRAVTIDATNASALPGDMLAGFTIAVETPGANQFPFVAYLPNLAASAVTTVNAGVQAGSIHDDRANSGALLAFAIGSVVGVGGTTTGALRTGSLQPDHLPGRPPTSSGGLALTTRGVLIAPAQLTSSPGATLALPNDFGLPAGAGAELFRLDASTGAWLKAADAVVDGTAAFVVSSAGVTAGGLYCFTAVASAGASISGRVLDLDGRGVPGALIGTAGASAETDGGGRFTLFEVPAVDGAGQPRTATVTVHGGRDYRAVRNATSILLTAPGAHDVGDITLDTQRVTLYRGLLVNRGRADPRRRARLSVSDGLTAARGFADGDARFDFEDVEVGGLISFVITRFDPRIDTGVLTAEGFQFLNVTDRISDQRVFFDEQQWIAGVNGDSTAYVLDKFGNGIIDGAAVFRNVGNGNDIFHGITDNGRLFRLDFGDLDGQATALTETQSDGRRVQSAFTVRRSRTARVELPLERARRAELGRFAPFALVTGSLDPGGDTRRVRSTRLLDREDWFDEVLGDEGSLDLMPVPVDPAMTGGLDFVAGVPALASNFVATAGATAAGQFTLERVWINRSLRLAAGTRNALALAAPIDADTNFVVADVVPTLDGAISTASLRFDYAIEFGAQELVDIDRTIAGNVTLLGADANFRLPALTGALGGARHLVALRGSATTGGVTIDQCVVAALDGASVPSAPFLAVPLITAPATGAIVSKDGFDVTFTPPPGAWYTVVRLRQETTDADGDVVRDWTAVLPPDDVSFRFRKLPGSIATPLADGSYTLSVSSARVGSGRLTRLDFPYERIASRWVGISLAEREVDAVSTASVTIILQ